MNSALKRDHHVIMISDLEFHYKLIDAPSSHWILSLEIILTFQKPFLSFYKATISW